MVAFVLDNQDPYNSGDVAKIASNFKPVNGSDDLLTGAQRLQ
jgi:hypothetical protein